MGVKTNERIFEEAIQQISIAADRQIFNFLRSFANEFYGRIEKHDFEWKDRTFQMRAGTGIGIYKKGILVEWKCSGPQNTVESLKKYAKRGNTETPIYDVGIDGNSLLMEALSSYTPDIDPECKYSIALFSAVPYSIIVDDGGKLGTNRGKNWFSELIEEFESTFVRQYKEYFGKIKWK